MSSRVGKIYVCPICGNEVQFVRDGGMPIVCCGQGMIKKEAGQEE